MMVKKKKTAKATKKATRTRGSKEKVKKVDIEFKDERLIIHDPIVAGQVNVLIEDLIHMANGKKAMVESLLGNQVNVTINYTVSPKKIT